MDYYRVQEQKVVKDLTLETLIKMAADGQISSDDMVRLDGQEHFVPVTKIEELKRALESSSHGPDSAAPPIADAPSAAPSPESTPTAAGLSDLAAKNHFEATAPLGRIRRRKAKEDDSGVDLTPMIDVVFLLLIFFIVTHTVSAKLPIKLPPAVYGKGITPDGDQAILIDKEGQYYLGEKKEESRVEGLDTLLEEVRKNARNAEPGLEVVINAHPESNHGTVRKLAEAVIQLDKVLKVEYGVAHKKQ
ncbi:MAG: biopolymer transporter ExbD [Pirellulales bacterium]|nr:biopolymer transporter ExbD [Pirellulales bacterium]